MTAAPSDAELAARQAALQAEAREVLATPGLAALLTEIGTAVLENGVRTPEQFAAWLAGTGRRDHLFRHGLADEREASAGPI